MNNVNVKSKNAIKGSAGAGKRISVPEQMLRRNFLHQRTGDLPFIIEIGYQSGTANHVINTENAFPEIIILLCKSGKGMLTINGKVFEFLPSMFVILNPKDDLKFEPDELDPWTLYWLKVGGMQASRPAQRKTLKEFEVPTYAKDLVEIHALFRDLLSALGNGCTEKQVIFANLTLPRLLALLLYNPDELRQEMKCLSTQVINYMNENIAENYDLATLAERFNYSASQFSYIFNKEIGNSPIYFFKQLKIQHSCKLLLNRDMKIYEVGMNVGFTDAFHFSRAFKLIMKIAPDKYRDELKQKSSSTSVDELDT